MGKTYYGTDLLEAISPRFFASDYPGRGHRGPAQISKIRNQKSKI